VLRNAPQTRHRQADRTGRAGEFWAGLWLMAKGYTILARRVRHPAGEIDLVILRGKVLAFVEVKTRPTMTEALLALRPGQREGLVRAAAGWAGRQHWAERCQWRFDLVAMAPWRLPRHVKDAWRSNSDPMLLKGTRAR
jgi:putative endonuclease